MVADGGRIVVLTHHQVTPRRDRQVVAHVQRLLVRAFHEQLNAAAVLARRLIAQDLAALDRTARCGGEVQFAVAPEYAFAARDQGRARRMTAHAEIVVGAVDVFHIDPFDLTPVADRPQALCPVGGVGGGRILQRHGLKAPALRQPSGRGRDEAVEQPVGPILGQIDHARPRIDAHRLMVEAPHAGQGLGLDQAGLARRHLEHPAVALRHVGGLRPILRLLAGQPGAPGRVAAAAIGAGADQAEVLALHDARVHVIDQRGRAAWHDAAVLGHAIGARPIDPLQPTGVVGPGRARPVRRRRRLQFVVAHQGDLGALQREAAHAVELSGNQQAVVHHLAGARQNAIGEALGQIEPAGGIGLQRTVARDLVDVGLLRRRQGVPPETGESQRRRSARHQASSVQGHGNTPGSTPRPCPGGS